MTFLNLSTQCVYSDGAINTPMSDPDHYLTMLRRTCGERPADRMSLPLGPRDIIEISSMTRLDSASQLLTLDDLHECKHTQMPR